MTSSLPTLEEARRAIAARVRPMPAELVAVGEALGRITAGAAHAAEPLPGFDNSAMDGFAVRAADTAGAPVTLRLADEEARAGLPAARGIGPGEAMRISTGAQLPSGADAVVRAELAEATGNGSVRVAVAVPPDRDVRRRGEEVGVGDALIEAGVRLRAADLGALAAAGVDQVACDRPARVAILVTGDELTSCGGRIGAGGVRDSNRTMLAAMARERAAVVTSSAAVGDDRAAIADAVLAALAGADLVVACGGMSVGPHDHVLGALAAAGVELVFAGVALTPGRPAAFGVAPGGPLVLGLPGNPLSALVAFRLLGEPALGLAPRVSVVASARAIPRHPSRTRAVPVRLTAGHAVPTGATGHGPTAALGADGLALVAPGDTELAASEPVEVALL